MADCCQTPCRVENGRLLAVLQGIDGVLKPGQLTLLLGPPGAGKSVLLQSLAGRLRPSKSLRVRGGEE